MIKQENNRGFSLYEVVVAVTIFAMFMVAIFEVFLQSYKANRIISEQLEAQSQGRKAVQEFVNEIRAANYSTIGTYPIAYASTTQVTFFSNIDEDNYLEMVSYYVSGSKLIKSVVKPTGTPMGYIGAGVTSTITESVYNKEMPVFYYYGQNYTGSSTPLSHPINLTEIRIVSMNLKIDKNPLNSPSVFIIKGDAELRNLKLN